MKKLGKCNVPLIHALFVTKIGDKIPSLQHWTWQNLPVEFTFGMLIAALKRLKQKQKYFSVISSLEVQKQFELFPS